MQLYLAVTTHPYCVLCTVRMSRIQSSARPALDYSQEARHLWARLGVDPDQVLHWEVL